MAVAEDLRVPLAPLLDAFGVDATVTRPEDLMPIPTRVIWLGATPQELPLGSEFRRQEPDQVLAIPLVDVPTVPTGTLIEGPAVTGGPPQTWRVDAIAHVEYDHVRVSVVSVEPAS